ncbi:MAG: hypothetical protein FJY58_09620 [Betaproteobacteria bacterium]|nr:hypothetical protein [Betaproteobacteria bacterium]
MTALVESFGSVALFNNSDGSFSVQDTADGASSFKTIKDYGSNVLRGGPGALAAADYYTDTVPSFSKADMSRMSITIGPKPAAILTGKIQIQFLRRRLMNFFSLAEIIPQHQ